MSWTPVFMATAIVANNPDLRRSLERDRYVYPHLKPSAQNTHRSRGAAVRKTPPTLGLHLPSRNKRTCLAKISRKEAATPPALINKRFISEHVVAQRNEAQNRELHVKPRFPHNEIVQVHPHRSKQLQLAPPCVKPLQDLEEPREFGAVFSCDATLLDANLLVDLCLGQIHLKLMAVRPRITLQISIYIYHLQQIGLIMRRDFAQIISQNFVHRHLENIVFKQGSLRKLNTPSECQHLVAL